MMMGNIVDDEMENGYEPPIDDDEMSLQKVGPKLARSSIIQS